jgi:hypothetical protein
MGIAEQKMQKAKNFFSSINQALILNSSEG